MDYKKLRTLYYSGIFILVLYGLQAIPLVNNWFIPILNFEIVTGVPIISVVAIAIGVGAFSAFKFRTIG